MDFTREPVIQTVITPKEGFRLVVRSSKTQGLEEHFVDAVEVVCFGSATFFRSIERPKPFIVPAADYEVLEVRETRVVLKTPIVSSQKQVDKQRQKAEAKAEIEKQGQPVAQEAMREKGREQVPPEGGKLERRKDRRRGFRRRRGREGALPEQEGEQQAPAEEPTDLFYEGEKEVAGAEVADKVLSTAPMLSSILPPPTKLIRDDLERLRGTYKDAFYDVPTDEDEDIEESNFPNETFETDVRLKEGGDEEVPQSDPFRQNGFFPQDATNAQKNDE